MSGGREDGIDTGVDVRRTWGGLVKTIGKTKHNLLSSEARHCIFATLAQIPFQVGSHIKFPKAICTALYIIIEHLITNIFHGTLNSPCFQVSEQATMT